MEDYVPFNLAKKLKEKGFDWETSNVYERNTIACRYEDYTKPTISQVLKWLFDEKQLFVNINCNLCDEFGLFFTIYKKGKETWEACGFDDNYYNKPEEAALAGIKYILENLI